MGWSLCQTDSEHPTFNDLKSINKVMIHVSNYLLLLNFMVMYVPKICPHLRNISSKQVPKYLIIDIVRDALLSRNFCQKSVRVNFCDFHNTVLNLLNRTCPIQIVIWGITHKFFHLLLNKVSSRQQNSTGDCICDQKVLNKIM